MKTRQEYLAGEISHRAYYAQFITNEMREQVRDKIGIERIRASKDEHYNDIPLREWDALSGHSFRGSEMIGRPQVSREFAELCKQANEGISSATLTCVYKEIARQLAENRQRIEPLQLEIDVRDLENFPAWSTTSIAHVRVNNGKKWTDVWVSAIVKNGRVRFTLSHEKGYPSEEKGTTARHITANWLDAKTPIV
jgi:hypothetical protein